MVFFSEVDYNYLRHVLMWMIIIFDLDRDDKYGRLCFYLKLIICILALQVVPTIHICFKYLTFDFLFNSLLFRFRESGQ